MERNKFKRADGLCTVYALACGYLNAASYGDDKQAVTMGAEGAVYFVKSRVHLSGTDRTLWAVFERDAQGYKKALHLFRCLRASLRYMHDPIGYHDTHPKLDFYGEDGKYLSSSLYYKNAAHAWANVRVSDFDCKPSFYDVRKAS